MINVQKNSPKKVRNKIFILDHIYIDALNKVGFYVLVILFAILTYNLKCKCKTTNFCLRPAPRPFCTSETRGRAKKTIGVAGRSIKIHRRETGILLYSALFGFFFSLFLFVSGSIQHTRWKEWAATRLSLPTSTTTALILNFTGQKKEKVWQRLYLSLFLRLSLSNDWIQMNLQLRRRMCWV